jgi:hypothetical protein
MQKKKIIAVVLVVAIVIMAFIGNEFFTVNSLSGYTKITLTPLPSIALDYQPCSIKFGNDVYYITFLHSDFQVLINNSSEGFGAIQGARYSFSGLQMIVGNINSNQLILYVKSTISNSKPIISSATSSTTPPSISSTNLPTCWWK